VLLLPLRAFIGMTAFEDLSREWILAQARAGWLPLLSDLVGSHWGKGVQVDVAAIHWRKRAILLGECKWGMERVGRSVIRELVERKTPKVRRALADQGTDWMVHYALFAHCHALNGHPCLEKGKPARRPAHQVNSTVLGGDIESAPY
jgi:hypothetical protein